MSETKFTPGPWKLCKNGECPCKQIWSIPGDFPVATADGFHVAAVHEHVADQPDAIYASMLPEMRDANAALIAAAPDLYAALEKCEVAIRHFEARLDLYDTLNEEDQLLWGKLWDSVEDVRAALTKARGET